MSFLFSRLMRGEICLVDHLSLLFYIVHCRQSSLGTRKKYMYIYEESTRKSNGKVWEEQSFIETSLSLFALICLLLYLSTCSPSLLEARNVKSEKDTRLGG